MKTVKIAYGVTVWQRGRQTGHLDGIGVYTRELFQALQPLLKDEHAELLPLRVDKSDETLAIVPHYPLHVLKKVLLKQRATPPRFDPMPRLFHATDHYIPALKNLPVVATIMDIIPFLHPEWVSGKHRAFKNYLFKQMILSADHWITISEHSKYDLVHHFGLPAARVSVTPLGVSAVYFERVSEAFKAQVLVEHALQPGFFLFVGTLQPRKNLETLLDAHACLPEAVQRAHPLVVVGKTGWHVSHLLSRLEEAEKAGTVKWLKYLPQPQIMALLQSAQALMFVSLYEGFGLPVLEAFAAQCPVIASKSTSIPEVAGEAAYLVDPQNKHAIAQAMVHLLDDKQLCQTLIEKGQARAREFTWARCAEATLDVYREVIKFHPNGRHPER